MSKLELSGFVHFVTKWNPVTLKLDINLPFIPACKNYTQIDY